MKFSFDHSGKTLEEITRAADGIKDYVASFAETAKKTVYDAAETSINLAADTKNINACKTLAKSLAGADLRYIIDIGIGGSNLGTKAVYDALNGAFDTIEPDRMPKMIFCDTTDPEFLSKLTTLLGTIKKPAEVIINVISKSGSTTETITNAEIVVTALVNFKDGIKERIVVTTDEGSPMDKKSGELGVHILHMPVVVGGRYSVLSSVGLFPLACAGVDIDALCSGALSSRERALSTTVADNSSLLSASILFLQSKDGKNINDNFLFHTELESLGKWYRQLMGESIGKDGVGITPTVSIGSTDLHSMAQLYFGGPKDKITTIITTQKPVHDVSVPSSLMFSGLVKNIEGRNVSEIMKAISDATKISYANESIPFMDVELSTVDEFSIGEFMQFKMIEMMFLGKLFGVNTFDQPHVEIYKKEMKRLMARE